jgi:hypothetical protein
MAEGRRGSGSRAWTARRLAVSAFVTVHMGATLVQVMPPCPLKQACHATVMYYIFPLGLWQYWGMFGPDPMKESISLEAEVVDARGLRATFAFPKLADYSVWRGIPRFRYSKYAANLVPPEAQVDRTLAARHAVRRLEVPDEAFPVDVKLILQAVPAPPPGSTPDPMTPPLQYIVGALHFESPKEVRR